MTVRRRFRRYLYPLRDCSSRGCCPKLKASVRIYCGLQSAEKFSSVFLNLQSSSERIPPSI
jgi:hypothetical protein